MKMKRIMKVLLLISILNIKWVYADVITNHSTYSHTKEEIRDKFFASMPQFDYYNESIYNEYPEPMAPYKEGSLKPGVETDILNQLNFYRWLGGLNQVSLNYARQANNQKGAMILFADGIMSHKPPKPDDMSDDFYNQGYEACGSKSGQFQGNISAGIGLLNIVEAYITDSSNIEPSVAHRASLLKPEATAMSFGYVYGYSTMSIHYGPVNTNPDSFYAWPPAGYFPTQVMLQSSQTRWSIYLKNYSLQPNTTVTLIHNNKEYKINRENINYIDYARTMFYDIPEELRKLISTNLVYNDGEKVTVRVDNLSNNTTISYEVKFFEAEEVKAEKIELDKTELTIEKGIEEILTPTITPSNTFNKEVTWTSSNENIVTVDEKGFITGVGEGVATITVQTENEKVATCQVTVTKPTTRVSYQSHVQSYGWQKHFVNGETSGTTGEGKRLEAIKIKLEYTPYTGNILYRTYIENTGWEKEFKKNDETSGTEGEGKYLEAIEIKLDGEMANHYDIYYRVYARKFGWLGWARDGESAGTTGYGYRLEAIEIKLVKKEDTVEEYGKTDAFIDRFAPTSITLNQKQLTMEVGDEQELLATIEPNDATNKEVTWTTSNKNIVTVDKNGKIKGIKEGTAKITAKTVNGKETTCQVTVTKSTVKVSYKTHVQTYGWQDYVENGKMSGTEGEAKRLEGIKIKLKKQDYSGNILYRTHIQTYGWEKEFKKNDEMSGTSGEAKRLEAIEIKLDGEMANHYDIYYRVHAQTFGWLGWAKNGEQSGTAGFAKRLEGIEIKLVEKNNPFEEYGKEESFKEKKIEYTTHVQNIGWQDYTYDGNMAGTSGQALRLEAIKIKLNNQKYSGNILYRTHIQTYGWEKEFKKNDEMSGTSGLSKRLEAIEIKLDGEMAKHYDIYYRVHAQTYGWLNWAKNGEKSGTSGLGKRLEGIEIVIVDKGEKPPVRNNTNSQLAFVE